MRIDQGKQAIGAKVDGAASVRGTASLRDVLGLDGDDRVQVSDTARMLVRLRSEVGAVDGVRDDVVASFRDRIARGDYQPDYPGVAQNLLRDVMEQVVS